MRSQRRIVSPNVGKMAKLNLMGSKGLPLCMCHVLWCQVRPSDRPSVHLVDVVHRGDDHTTPATSSPPSSSSSSPFLQEYLRSPEEKASSLLTDKVARWQNLIPSFSCIAPGVEDRGRGRRNPRKGRDQILQRSVAEPLSLKLKGPNAYNL